MGFSFQDADNGWKAIGRAIDNARDRDVKVGVQSDAGGELVNVATWNEYGTKHIPARSFVRSAIDKGVSEIARAAGEFGRRVLFNAESQEVALGKLGLVVARKIQEQIRSNVPPPNAPETIERKKSSKTLIDKGQLRQSIRHKVVDRSEP